MTKLLLPLLFTVFAIGCTNKSSNSSGATDTALVPNVIPAPASGLCSEDYLRSLKSYEKAYSTHSENVRKRRSTKESQRSLKRACLQFTNQYQGTQCTNSRGVARNSSEADAFCGVVTPNQPNQQYQQQTPAFLSQYITGNDGDCRNGQQNLALKFNTYRNSDYRQRTVELALFLYSNGQYRLVQMDNSNFNGFAQATLLSSTEGSYSVTGDSQITLQQNNARVYFRPGSAPQIETTNGLLQGQFGPVSYDSRGSNSGACR